MRLSPLNCHQVSDAQCSTVHSIRAQNHSEEAGWAEDTVLTECWLPAPGTWVTLPHLILRGEEMLLLIFLKDEFTEDQRD